MADVVHLTLPVGATSGWGVCGRNLARGLAKLGPVALLTKETDVEQLGDELEQRALARLLPDRATVETLLSGRPFSVAGPMLQPLTGDDLTLAVPGLRGTRNVGYCFFETTPRLAQAVARLGTEVDTIVAGSTYNETLLRQAGATRVETVLQGIDPELVFPRPRVARDEFRIFSGGKFELRKGQDIAARAVGVLQSRHRDVVLVAAWASTFPQTLATMALSKHVPFAAAPHVNQAEMFSQFLVQAGVDVSRAVLIGPRHHARMPNVYWATDVGLFPNRCEGGTNLVLMEYMACGRAAIAALNSGHLDVVSAQTALPIVSHETLPISGPEGATWAEWFEPSLDETIERLEWAYQHRDELDAVGARGAAAMQALTWDVSASKFDALLRA